MFANVVFASLPFGRFDRTMVACANFDLLMLLLHQFLKLPLVVLQLNQLGKELLFLKYLLRIRLLAKLLMLT